MGLDIRIPIGLLFSALAIVLIVFGLVSDPAIYLHSLGINVNIVWGGVMLLFGAVMLATGWWSRRTDSLASKQEREADIATR
jgi:hypothetical protein